MGAQILQFPRGRKTSTTKKIKNVDGFKYFTKPEIKLLRRTVRDAALAAQAKGTVTAVREWMVIDLLTTTGIRVGEAANLRVGDCKLGYGHSEIFIRCGKGHKSRTVPLPKATRNHLKQFITWKQQRGEPTGFDDHVFMGQRGAWTTQAIQQVVKKWLKKLNLYENGKSVHALRHSYAVELYRNTKDLRLVQKLLGHSSIQTTTIYADVLREDMHQAVKGLWRL